MVIQGKVKDGVVVLSSDVVLRERATVQVIIEDTRSALPETKTLSWGICLSRAYKTSRIGHALRVSHLT